MTISTETAAVATVINYLANDQRNTDGGFIHRDDAVDALVSLADAVGLDTQRARALLEQCWPNIGRDFDDTPLPPLEDTIPEGARVCEDCAGDGVDDDTRCGACDGVGYFPATLDAAMAELGSVVAELNAGAAVMAANVQSLEAFVAENQNGTDN